MIKKTVKKVLPTKVFEILSLLKNSRVYKATGGARKYPKVIQLPITYKCNSRCVMCNIWKMDYSNEMSLEEMAKFMADPLFKEVRAVGINGGEPSLIKNLPEYIYYVLKLPKIKSLNIISHGFNTTRLLRSVEAIYAMCKKNNVSFHISISLDGFGKVHDEVRRIPKGFYKTMHTINAIRENKGIYCDSFDIGCTVVKQNIYWINQLKVFAQEEKLDIKFRLGIENKRIESNRLVDQFSVIYSDFRQSAKEFFYSLMLDSKRLNDKYKYYCIFDWLNSSQPKRKLGCMWQEEGVTLDSRGDIYYCAVASEKIGSLRESPGEDVFFSDNSIQYRKSIIRNDCDNCIHDYTGAPTFKNRTSFIFFILKNRYYSKIFRILICKK